MTSTSMAALPFWAIIRHFGLFDTRPPGLPALLTVIDRAPPGLPLLFDAGQGLLQRLPWLLSIRKWPLSCVNAFAVGPGREPADDATDPVAPRRRK